MYKQSPWHGVNALCLIYMIKVALSIRSNCDLSIYSFYVKSRTVPRRRACGRRPSCCMRASWR